MTFTTTGSVLQSLVSRGTQPFSQFTHIILDEVHEREIQSDFTNALMRILREEFPFKLIIMSATLQGDLFGKFFAEAESTSAGPIDQMRLITPIDVGAKRYETQEFFLDDFQISGTASSKGKGRSLFDHRGSKGKGRKFTHSDFKELAVSYSTDGSKERSSKIHLNVDLADALVKSNAYLDYKSTSSTSSASASASSFLRTQTGRTTGNVPSPVLFRGYERVIVDLIRATATRGESILIFLPGLADITDLSETLHWYSVFCAFECSL